MPKVTLRVKRASKATPKIKAKTSKSFAKRFSTSGNGLIMSTQAGKRHNMSQKTKRKLLLSKGTKAAHKSLSRTVRCALNLKLAFFQKRDKINKYNCQKSFIIVPKLIKKLLPSI